MIIRRADKNDIDGINKLLYQVQHIHHLGRPDLFKYGAKKYTDSELSGIIEDDSSPIFVAVDENNSVLGYAFCVFREREETVSVTKLKTLYIDDLCVDEVCRGQHIGKCLCEYVREFALQQNCDNITLNVWALNPNAYKFYEACGFAPQKTYMEYRLND